MTPNELIADICRDLAMELESSFNDGHRGQEFDMWDMIETLNEFARRVEEAAPKMAR